MSANTRAALWSGLWVAIVAVLLAYVLHSLEVSTDLRLFLPRPASSEQALVLEGIGEGPGARLLLVALDGGEPATLAEASHAMVARLRGTPAFRLAENGSGEIPGWVVENRYLLTPGLDVHPLDARVLRDALEERLQDLASPAGPVLESIIPSDPTLEIASIASAWAPRHPPRTINGAWFDGAGSRALLLVETQAAGFDPDGQQRALAELDSAFRSVSADPSLRMSVTGPGRFSALMKERTQKETAWLGTAAMIGLVILLVACYRRWRVLVLAPLPLAVAALAGLAAVGFAYGEVHGITLAFGFTLIGVAQDYPIHFFSHQRRGLGPLLNVQQLWPTLATGVAATCVAYLAFLASGVTGLAQLGVFSITGLLVAGLATRYLLPRVSGDDFRDPAHSQALAHLEELLSVPRIPPAVYAAIGAACVAIVLFVPGPVWENDLGALTPVPPELLIRDAELRAEIGALDARYLAVVTTNSLETALQELERLTPGLESLIEAGAIAGFEHAARYLPSARRQRERQARLPGRSELEIALAAATQGLPFRAGIFKPFVADVSRARESSPVTPATITGTAQARLVDGLVHDRNGGSAAVVAFSGVSDPDRLRDWANDAGSQTVLIDLKRAATALAVAQRERILNCLLFSAALLVLIVRAALGDWQRTARVLMPMALTTVAVVAVLRAGGQPLNLFHLMSLVLTAGLGIDYALFFERAGADRDERLRTLHAVLVCSLSTLMVFAMLSFSSIPVLRSIGVTVALGVAMNFMLALAMGRATVGR